MRLRAERLDWVPGTLAALDSPFVIEHPSALRDEVAALAKRLESYASGETLDVGPRWEATEITSGEA